MDTLDMGEKRITPSGHRYICIFKILKSRYVMIFLHKTKDEFPELLLKAFAQAGKTLKILRTDGAAELNSEQVQGILLERGIFKETSNAYEQHGNGPSETVVRTLDDGIRAALVDSNLPYQYWGYAAVNFIDIYNHLPHSALDNKTPWECEKGTKPDVSWFRPFGCRATVFVGMNRDNMDHQKLAPRGVSAIYLGLGFHQGQKGWLCWAPEMECLFCTRNVVFDETFMPARTHDQRILGYYNTTPRTHMATLIHGSMAEAERAVEENTLPGWSPELSDAEVLSANDKPCARLDHEEGDLILAGFEDGDEESDM